MGQQFCTVCGAKLPEGIKFCESCGAQVDPKQVSPVTTSSPAQGPPPGPVAGTLSEGSTRKFPMKIIAGIFIFLVIAAAAVLIMLPKIQGGSLPALPGQATPTPTMVTTPTPAPVTIVTTVVPTNPPDPFPDAFKRGELFNFNEGKYKSRATVYRYWINETYHWHNDMDNKYYTEPNRPNPGYKYLLIFVNIENIGSDGYPYPKSNMIVVHNKGNLYRVDTTHYLPNKAGDKKATPVEILELESQSDYYKMERVEDYGFSHATTQDFVNPGQGNAIDGYLIYIVPDSLTPENTYVEIVFDGQDRAVWKLA